MIYKLEAMHFTKAKMAIITRGLVTNFAHSCVALVLLALIHSHEPARFYSQRIKPINMAIHPQSAQNRVSQAPIA